MVEKSLRTVIFFAYDCLSMYSCILTGITSMGSFDELIEKKVVLDERDQNTQAILLHKDSAMKVMLSALRHSIVNVRMFVCCC